MQNITNLYDELAVLQEENANKVLDDQLEYKDNLVGDTESLQKTVDKVTEIRDAVADRYEMILSALIK